MVVDRCQRIEISRFVLHHFDALPQALLGLRKTPLVGVDPRHGVQRDAHAGPIAAPLGIVVNPVGLFECPVEIPFATVGVEQHGIGLVVILPQPVFRLEDEDSGSLPDDFVEKPVVVQRDQPVVTGRRLLRDIARPPRFGRQSVVDRQQRIEHALLARLHPVEAGQLLVSLDFIGPVGAGNGLPQRVFLRAGRIRRTNHSGESGTEGQEAQNKSQTQRKFHAFRTFRRNKVGKKDDILK